MTRSVGLKGQGGPGVSETRGGACGVIDRRHEAPPRVTGKPSATLRLRHPVPARPPFWLYWRRLLKRVRNESSLSRVRRTVCFGCSNRQPTCVHNGAAPTSVVLPPVRSLSSVGLVGLSDPTAVSSGDWWVVLGLDLLRSDWSEIGGRLHGRRQMYGESARLRPTGRRLSSPPPSRPRWRVC